MITFSHSIGQKMKHRYQSFTRFGHQFQSLKRQLYAVWTSVSFPLCQRSCLISRKMTNRMTNTYVVIFLSASISGRSYHSRYQNFEFTETNLYSTHQYLTYSMLVFLSRLRCADTLESLDQSFVFLGCMKIP